MKNLLLMLIMAVGLSTVVLPVNAAATFYSVAEDGSETEYVVIGPEDATAAEPAGIYTVAADGELVAADSGALAASGATAGETAGAAVVLVVVACAAIDVAYYYTRSSQNGSAEMVCLTGIDNVATDSKNKFVF